MTFKIGILPDINKTRWNEISVRCPREQLKWTIKANVYIFRWNTWNLIKKLSWNQLRLPQNMCALSKRILYKRKNHSITKRTTDIWLFLTYDTILQEEEEKKKKKKHYNIDRWSMFKNLACVLNKYWHAKYKVICETNHT